MPIRTELRPFYGAEWRAYRLELIETHGAFCSVCRREVLRYLNLAHLTHDPRASDVALLCPACHASHDAPQRLAMTRRSRAKRSGQLWLLPEIEWAPYPAWLMPGRVFDALAQGRLF